MSFPRRSLLAIWLAFQLLLAQQFALAHHVDHLAEKLAVPAIAGAAAVHDSGESESAAHVLSHVCTSCLACLGFGAALACCPLAVPTVETGPALVTVAALPAPTVRRLPAFRSRAPPLLQD